MRDVPGLVSQTLTGFDSTVFTSLLHLLYPFSTMPQPAGSRSFFSFFPRLRKKWQGNLRFRHTVILSSIILAIMISLAGIMLSKQRAMLYHAVENKGVAFTQAFAVGGWAALHNNLYRIQESLLAYPPDPDILDIEIIDRDNLIIASQRPDKIGLTIENPEWLEMKQHTQPVFRYKDDKAGKLYLIIVAPLLGPKEMDAWIRVVFSLQNVYQEEMQLILRMTLTTLLLLIAGIFSLNWSQSHISSILQRVIHQLHNTLATGTGLKKHPSSQDSSGPETLQYKGDLEHLEQTVTETVGLIKTQSEALHNFTSELEKTVNVRTIALLETTQSLETEIQERQLASEQLEKMSHQNQLILNSVGEGIYGLDVHGQTTFINPAGAKLLGYEIDELLGKPMHETVHHTKPDGTPYPREECPMYAAVKDGIVHKVENEILWCKDGSNFPVEYTSTPIFEQKKIVGAVVSFSDISLRQKAEAKTRKNESKLRQAQKMEAMGTLAGGIAHDFNNILTAMLGFSQLAQIKISRDNQAYEYLNHVLVAGKRAKALIKQILTFSRQTEPEHQPIQLRLVLEEVLTLMQATMPATIDVQKHFSHEDGMVLADPVQLHQVFINLFANAEYALRGKAGNISVKLEQFMVNQGNQDKYPDLAPGPYLRVRLADTGAGIPPQAVSRIFDPFFTTKDVGEGTGMGLSVAHGIIVAHGGIVTVKSHLGMGTTFYIFLPNIDAIPTVSSGQTEIPHYPKQQGHILFVDDEESLCIMGQDFLEHLGYTVTVCSNGVTALEIFQSNPRQFDAVITDQTMPKLTGDMFATELLRINPNLPIILYTGFSHTMTPEKSHRLGIRRLLHKPLLIEDLASVLNELLHPNA